MTPLPVIDFDGKTVVPKEEARAQASSAAARVATDVATGPETIGQMGGDVLLIGGENIGAQARTELPLTLSDTVRFGTHGLKNLLPARE